MTSFPRKLISLDLKLPSKMPSLNTPHSSDLQKSGRFSWLLDNFNAIACLFLLLVIVVTMQAYLLPLKHIGDGAELYTEYNNYLIFKYSFFHLIHQEDLYIHYPAEYGDLYKYSPAFALAMGTLAFLPDPAGLFIWNLLNVFCLYLAFRMLPGLTVRTRVLMMLFVLVEMVTATQNCQSNTLIAGMIILAFVMLEKERPIPAALLITGTVFIKIFGLVAFALFLFYPRKFKFILSASMSFLLLALIPLVVVSWSQLIFLYQSWFGLLASDHAVKYGISVMGWLTSWFPLAPNKNLVVLMGGALFCIPLFRVGSYRNYTFRTSMLASVLLWVVIFNHMAESPTFIIAIAGVAVWYFTGPPDRFNLILLLLALLFTELSPTDIYPSSVRHNIFDPYVIKAVPCIFIWIKIIFDALRRKPDTQPV